MRRNGEGELINEWTVDLNFPSGRKPEIHGLSLINIGISGTGDFVISKKYVGRKR